MELGAARAQVLAEVDRLAPRLVEVSRELFAHPELCFEEHRAHDLLAGELEAAGLATTRHAHGLATAFEATAGTAGPTVAVLLEYDALPGLGHACGHNVIGAAGLGAGLATATVAEALGGRVRILGTPAEEGGGGKVVLLEAGAFDDVDAALMVHGADHDLTRIDGVAKDAYVATYHGVAAHAAAAPEAGRNALDAAVLGYLNVAALRQHIGDGERVHGVFTDGGAKPNIVPERAETSWYVRSPTLERLEALVPRVLAALEAGAAATGCRVDIVQEPPVYTEVRDNPVLVERWVANAAEVGNPSAEPDAATAVVASTDMGNVSRAVPSIHPMVRVAPAGVAIHTAEFARHAGGPGGDAAVVAAARAMALTVVDLWARPGVLEAARAAFEADRAARAGGSGR
jgi:amidohydrolase